MIQLVADADALAHAVARRFADEARKAVALRGRFVVALAGGSTPNKTYALLAKQPYFGRVPWHAVHFFWGDERCVPWDDPKSNYGMARKLLLDHLPVQPWQIHPVHTDQGAQAAALAYEHDLSKFFGVQAPCFDLVLLGLGEDGHTASLLPGSEALSEATNWTSLAKRPEENFTRVTLTFPILNQARLALFIVAGESKAAIVQHVLQNTDAALSYPAQYISLHNGRIDWMLDRAACPDTVAPCAEKRLHC